MNIQETNQVHEAYQHLLQAEKNKKSVAPLTELYPGITIHDAY